MDTDRGGRDIIHCGQNNNRNIDESLSLVLMFRRVIFIYPFGEKNNADPSAWENLEYLNVSYGGEDAEIYEEELKHLFPDCEISLE